jgi:hypothetical protein
MGTSPGRRATHSRAGGSGGWSESRPGPRGSLRVADLRGGPPEDLLEQAAGVFQVEAVQERFASLGRGPAQVPRSGP